MRHVSLLFIILCALCYGLSGCGDDSGSSSGSSSSEGTPSGGTQAAHPAPSAGGITGGAAGIGAPPLGGHSGGTQTQPGGDLVISGVAPESIIAHPDQSIILMAGGLPIVRNNGPNGEPAERDIVFLGKFPSTNRGDYTVAARIYDPENRTQSLTVTSVSGDRLVIHFPPASGANMVSGKMEIQVKCQGKSASIHIYIP